MATLVTPTEKRRSVEKKSPPVTDDKAERKQRPRTDEKFKIFSGTANEPLADEVCQFLGMQRGQAQVIRFRGWRSVTSRFRRTCAAPTCS